MKALNKFNVEILLLLIGVLFFPACAQEPVEYASPKGYNFELGQKVFLPDVLHEISGIAFPHEKDDLIYAVEDESGKVYSFPPTEPSLRREVVFAGPGDYEGVAINEGLVWVLKSNGTLYSFPLDQTNQKKANGVKEAKNVIPKGEYESLAASDGLLYVICKDCPIDKGSTLTSGYVLEYSEKGDVTKKAEFKLDAEKINQKASLKGKRIRPSALTQHPSTKQWYILSSIDKMLVVADENWQIVDAYSLNPKLFNQPESIAFDSQKNLYIGNEGGDKTRKSTLLKFTLIP